MKEVNSLFEEPWWLDAVAPHQWECLEVKKGGEIVGRWPICYGKLFGFKVIKNPKYTQTLGPWIKCDSLKYTKYLSTKKRILEELIEQIPKKYNNIFITLDSSNEYILPFRWKGFLYSPTFSYRFDDLSDINSIWEKMDNKRKKRIIKAQEKLIIKDDCSLDILISMMKKSNERQNRKKRIDVETIFRIDEACKKNNARKFLVAIDNDGNYHAAKYLVYDEKVCYDLLGGADPLFRESDAQSLLMWESIKFASTVSKAFDMEGSNVEYIEQNFRSFGAPFVVNYTIKRLNILLLIADMLSIKVKSKLLKQHI